MQRGQPDTLQKKANTMKHFINMTAAFAILSSVAFAQPMDQSLSGTFVLAEEGSGVSQPVASIAILNFASGGTVMGTQLLRGPGTTVKNNVQGTYLLNSDGTGSLALTSQTMATEDSQSIVTSINYQLRGSKTRGIAAIRTDPGLFTIALLSPAAAAGPIKGGFILAERANGVAYAGLGILSFDGTNAVAGSERVASVGSNVVNNLTGTYAVGSDGFGTLTLSVPATDADGNTSYTTANYVFVAGANQIFAIRTDAGTAFVSTLTAMQ